jgi:hypothetical protein
MHCTGLSPVDGERERLALRLLEIGYVLMGTGKGSRGNDATRSQQYERLRDEAERIAQRLYALDRLDAPTQKPRGVTPTWASSRGRSR